MYDWFLKSAASIQRHIYISAGQETGITFIADYAISWSRIFFRVNLSALVAGKVAVAYGSFAVIEPSACGYAVLGISSDKSFVESCVTIGARSPRWVSYADRLIDKPD
jgi:hypothetical protein